jgi:hypothetical protein
MRLEELKASSRAADSKLVVTKSSASVPKAALKPAPKATEAVSVEVGFKTARITRSATPAASKATRVTKITKGAKTTATPNKKLGNDKKSFKVAAASKAPVSARTRSQDVTGAHTNKGKKRDTA